MGKKSHSHRLLSPLVRSTFESMSFFSSDWDDDEEEDVFQGDVDALVRDFESKQRKTFSAREWLELYRYYASQFPAKTGQYRADTYIKVILETAIQQFPYMPIFSLHMAEWLVRDQKLAKARNVVSQALQYTPFEPALGFMQALIFSLQGHKKKAMEELQSVLTNMGDEEAMLEDFLEISLYHGQFDLAMPVLEKALDTGAEVSVILEKYIEKAEEGGLIDALLPMIQRIIDQDPYSAEAWYVMGSGHMAQGDHEQALKALDFAVTINENFADAWVTFLECTYELGHYQDFINTYKELATRFPKRTFAEVEGLLAWSHYEQGDVKTCRSIYKEILKHQPQDAECWYSMGLTWHYEENYSAAIPYLERAYDLDHFESDYGMVLASAYFGAHMQEKWEALYESLTIEHATNPEVWLDYSTSLYEIGESDKALDVIETGLLNNPQHSGLLYRLAALCYLSGQASAAIFVLEKALEINANEHIQLFTFAPELKKATAILNCVAKFTQPRTGS